MVWLHPSLRVKSNKYHEKKAKNWAKHAAGNSTISHGPTLASTLNLKKHKIKYETIVTMPLYVLLLSGRKASFFPSTIPLLSSLYWLYKSICICPY